MIKIIYAFITSLPEIMKLIKHLQEEYKKEQVERKIKDDFKLINQAFKTKDVELLNAVFNGVPDPNKTTDRRDEAH